jgi:hypothetical protein
MVSGERSRPEQARPSYDELKARLRSQLAAHSMTRHLVRNDALMHLLTSLVALYAPGGTWWECRLASAGQSHPLRVTKGKTIRVAEARPKAQHLANALDRVEALLLDPHLAPLIAWTTWSPAKPNVQAVGGVVPWLKALGEIRAAAEETARQECRGARGRPIDRWRDLFCRGIGCALADAGERLRKSRDGLFARVLVSAFRATGEASPEDPFPLVCRAVDALRRSRPPQ